MNRTTEQINYTKNTIAKDYNDENVTKNTNKSMLDKYSGSKQVNSNF